MLLKTDGALSPVSLAKDVGFESNRQGHRFCDHWYRETCFNFYNYVQANSLSFS
jgi:hypothetical protein